MCETLGLRRFDSIFNINLAKFPFLVLTLSCCSKGAKIVNSE